MAVLHRSAIALLVLLSSPLAADPAQNQPAAPREPRDAGLLVGVALGVGTDSTTMIGARLGVIVHRRVSLFGEAMGFVWSGGGISLLGGGVRLSTDWLFLDARFGRAHKNNSCDFDDPCTSEKAIGAALGVGIELLHTKHGGLELRGDLLRAFDDTYYGIGIGGALYVL